MPGATHALRAVKRLHSIHHAKHKHVVAGHGLELAGAILSLLKWELLAQFALFGGAVILLLGLFIAAEE